MQQAPLTRESSDDIIKVKQEVRDDDMEDANVLPANDITSLVPRDANNHPPPNQNHLITQANGGQKVKSKSTKGGDASIEKAHEKSKNYKHQSKEDRVKGNHSSLHKQRKKEEGGDGSGQEADKEALQDSRPKKGRPKEKKVCSELENQTNNPEDDEQDKEYKNSSIDNKKVTNASKNNKALDQKRIAKLQQKVDQKCKKAALNQAAAISKDHKIDSSSSQTEKITKHGTERKEKEASILDELPKECIYCLAKRLYIGTNAKIKSKESISSRFTRLDSIDETNKRSKSLTVKFSKESQSRKIYKEKDQASEVDEEREKSVEEDDKLPVVKMKEQKNQKTLKQTPPTTSSSANQVTDINRQSEVEEEKELSVKQSLKKASQSNKTKELKGSGGQQQKFESEDQSKKQNKQVLVQKEEEVQTRKDQVISATDNNQIYFWNGLDAMPNNQSAQAEQLPSIQQKLPRVQQQIQQTQQQSKQFRQYDFDSSHQQQFAQQQQNSVQDQYSRGGYAVSKFERPSEQSVERQTYNMTAQSAIDRQLSFGPAHSAQQQSHQHYQNQQYLGGPAEYQNQPNYHQYPHAHQQQVVPYSMQQQQHGQYSGMLTPPPPAIPPTQSNYYSHSRADYYQSLDQAHQQQQYNYSAQSLAYPANNATTGQSYDPLDNPFLPPQSATTQQNNQTPFQLDNHSPLQYDHQQSQQQHQTSGQFASSLPTTHQSHQQQQLLDHQNTNVGLDYNINAVATNGILSPELHQSNHNHLHHSHNHHRLSQSDPDNFLRP